MHSVIFDIGKTNKKLFVFDNAYQEVYKEYVRFEEIKDDEGHPSDHLEKITAWIRSRFDALLNDASLEIESVNFSTYGASLVYLDGKGKVLTPLYNYTKPYPSELQDTFYARNGGRTRISLETASPPSGMLNSGLQLYWLKYHRPEIYEQARYALHFPQYLSYLFTGIPVSDYTSIGCHTGLWDFQKNGYHNWVYNEGIDRLLAPLVPTKTSINVEMHGRNVRVGVGIHDSSAALIPYLRAEKKPFLLISTGTWSIALNPFNTELLTADELDRDCLNYLRVDGKPVKAARLFLGNEYKRQVENLCAYFNHPYGYHRTVQFDEAIYIDEVSRGKPVFRLKSLPTRENEPSKTDLSSFGHFESAFHRLMIELMALQFDSAKQAIGQTPLKKIYIDGGFADNAIFVKMASHYFKEYKLRTTKSPLGSALGAAMVISDKRIKPKFLKKHYSMRKHASYTLPA